MYIQTIIIILNSVFIMESEMSAFFTTPLPGTPPHEILPQRERRTRPVRRHRDGIDGRDGIETYNPDIENTIIEANRLTQFQLTTEVIREPSPQPQEPQPQPQEPQSLEEIAVKCWKEKWDKFLREPNDTIQALREYTSYLPFVKYNYIDRVLEHYRKGYSISECTNPF